MQQLSIRHVGIRIDDPVQFDNTVLVLVKLGFSILTENTEKDGAKTIKLYSGDYLIEIIHYVNYAFRSSYHIAFNGDVPTFMIDNPDFIVSNYEPCDPSLTVKMVHFNSPVYFEFVGVKR
jgi:hypothetical protein